MNTKNNQQPNWIDNIGKITQIISNFFVIIGIFFAFTQIKQADFLDKRRTSIEAVKLLYSQEFTSSLARIVGVIEEKSIISSKIKEDINVVYNSCRIVSLMYNNGITDKIIIENSAYPKVLEFWNLIEELNEVNNEKINLDMSDIETLINKINKN